MANSKSGLTLGGLIGGITILFIGGVFIVIVIGNLFTGASVQNQATAETQLSSFANDMKYQINAKSIKPDSNHDGNVSVTIRYQPINPDGGLGVEKTESLICNYFPQSLGGGGCRFRTQYDSVTEY
jgi:hypothetical protein